MSESYRVAVVGATGQVGTLMLRLLRERNFPASEIVPFASPRSAGRQLDGGLTVRALDEDSIQGFELALFSAGGSTSAEWAPRFVAAGATVIDNSSHWRMSDDVPLVVSEVNPEALAGHAGIIANPNCSTMQMVVALAPLYREAGIERLVISTYQAVSGTGRLAVEELLEQSQALLHDRAIAAPTQYAHQIAFNALPHAGSFPPGDDHTDEERKLINETRKILGDGAIRVSATCVRVPVVTGHSEAVNVQTRAELSPERARRAAPGRARRDRHRRPRQGAVPARRRGGRPRRGVRRAHPPRPRPRARARHVGRRRQPPQGRRHQRRADRRAAPPARSRARLRASTRLASRP